MFIMPITVGAVILAVLVALVIAYRVASGPGNAVTGQTIGSIECNSGEMLAVHYHTHLQIVYHGQPAMVPQQIGITSSCFYWLHTHDTTGVIHIEAPQSSASRQFTLGDFFRVWDQPLSSKQVATFKVGGGDQMKAWVNGQPYTGNPAQIVLKSHENIVIEIGPPFDEQPPGFTWDTSQYAR
jgi:hypothetical protein